MTDKKNRKAIEESFPVVEINRLAMPEKNAFKPIYQMHKWFARRASCVFRAILLAAMKPAGTDIMTEFYEDHTNDPDTRGVRILDPFMGGGTTVVEALRLGCHVTGIDLNPVAWFIVKAEVEPTDVDELKAAFKRLEECVTTSGKLLRDELLSHYKTECPCCGAGREEADIIYTLWVKEAICTNPTCKKEVPLFSSFIIAKKSPSIRYVSDYQCSKCQKAFDLDIDRASLIAEESMMVTNPRDGAGDRRSNKRWATYDPIAGNVKCPWCSQTNKLPGENIRRIKKTRKKVPLTVLLCPHCYSVWQYRGTLPDETTCPACSQEYSPNKGNTGKGSFLCPSCGTKDKTINAIRRLPQNQRFSTKPYAIEGYCSECAGETDQLGLFSKSRKQKRMATHHCNIRSNRGKFFKRIAPADLKRYQSAESRWQGQKDRLPYPKEKISEGQETQRLLEHHFYLWHQMFNPRQLLCLSTLLKAIEEEKDQELKEALLSAFQMCLEANNMFARYRTSSGGRSPFGGLFARHDFQLKNTPCEISVYGPYPYYGTFAACAGKVVKGKEFCLSPFDYKYFDGRREAVTSVETIKGQSDQTTLEAYSSELMKKPKDRFDLVITDPPYAGNVNYSELADFFYVWLRLSLSRTYVHFAPETSPKAEEIIENSARGKTANDYRKGLTEVWRQCYENLNNNGLMVFTFHHREGRAWESLLESLCNAGFIIEAIYPIHGESESSLHLMEKKGISYDLIHVCRKRTAESEKRKRSWAGVREVIRKKARKEIEMVEAGRYGKEKLSAADVNIILIGKCLELFSNHYGMIVDYKGDVVSLGEALSSIRIMVEQIVSTQQPLPSELEHIDPVSYIYLTCLCDRKEIKSDEVHKTTRGIMEPEVLTKAGVIRKGRAKRGRTYEVKLPNERYKDLKKLFKTERRSLEQLQLFPELEAAKFDKVPLVNVLHYLMGLAEEQENLVPWLNKFQPIIPNIRVAFEYLKDKNPTFQDPINKILSIIEV